MAHHGQEVSTSQRSDAGGNVSVGDPLRQIFELIRHHEAVRRNLTEVLNLHGITLEDARDLCATIYLDADANDVRALEHEGVRAVGRLHFLHGFTAEQISLMTDAPVELIAATIERSPRTQAQRQVMALHLDGFTPLEITRQIGVKRALIYRWLEEAGQTPNRRNVKIGKEERQQAITLYKRGASYAEICERTGLSETSVSTVLRTAHKQGELPRYGVRWAV